MEITKVTSLKDKESQYLRVGELTEGMIYEKVALVSSAGAGMAKTNSGFAKFYLKDADACVVTAFLFDVKDFAFAGIKLSQFKGKPVLVRFTPQVYNGRVSLVIDGSVGIREWTGEFDRKKFVGTVMWDQVFIEEFVQECTGEAWAVPVEYTLLSSDTFAFGKVGAFAKCLEILARDLKGYLPLIGEKEVVGKLFQVTAEVAFLCEKAKIGSEILTDTKVFDVILRMVNKYREDEHYAMILDVVKAISRQAEPKHLLSHVMTKGFRQAVEILNLIATNDSLIFGASTEIGGALLLKY